VQYVVEVRGDCRVGEVIALALNDVGGKAWWRRGCGILGEEADVPYEQAADQRVLAGRDRRVPVMDDAAEHPFEAVGAVGLPEVVPGLGDLHRDPAGEEASADHPVVRVVGLKQERLAGRKNAELAAAAGLPEIDLRKLRAGRKKPIPPPAGRAG
jgi:hypothetical protein